MPGARGGRYRAAVETAHDPVLLQGLAMSRALPGPVQPLAARERGDILGEKFFRMSLFKFLTPALHYLQRRHAFAPG